MKRILILFMVVGLSFQVMAQPTVKVDSTETTEIVTTENTPNEVTISAPELVKDDSFSFDDLPTSIDDIGELVTWFDALAIILFNLAGYLSFLIPGLRKIQDTETRVAAAGLILLGIFVTMDVNNAAKLAVEFVISTRVYDYVLKLFKKTPEVVITEE